MGTTTQIIPGWSGCDYSFARPAPAAMAAAGITFVCRYISGGTSGKNVHTPELDALHAAGIAVLINWEQSSGDALQGATLGTAHGVTAKAHAEADGYPHELPIINSVDTGVAPANMPAVEGYLRAFAAAIAPYPLGVYGGTYVIDRVADICVLGWQANASSWSPHPSSNVHVRQHTQAPDHQTDPDVCVQAFNAWLPHADVIVQADVLVQPDPVAVPAPPVATQPAPAPAPIFPPSLRALLEEDTMQYIADSDTQGSALITFVTTTDNVGAYRMAGVDGDTRNMAVIDGNMPAVHWPDDVYLQRASRSYHG